MARSIEEIRNDIATVQKAIDEIKARKENRGQFSNAQLAEMYSLDPEAAKFFANKQAQEELYKTKGTPKKETDEAKIRLIQTALNREKKNLDDAIKAFGQNSPQAIRANNLVKELTVEMQSEDPKVSNAYARAGVIITSDEQTKLEGIDVISEAIKNATYDQDGIIKDRDLIIRSIEDWRIANNISTEDPSYKGLIKLLEDKDKDKEAIAKGKAEREKEKTRVTEREADIWQKLEEEYGTLDKNLEAFEQSNKSTSDKTTLLNVILRKETGAAIASDETKNMIRSFLSDTDATMFSKAWDVAISEYVTKGRAALDALGTVLDKATGEPTETSVIPGLNQLIDTYTSKVNSDKMVKYGKRMLPSMYNKYKPTKVERNIKNDSNIGIGEAGEDD